MSNCAEHKKEVAGISDMKVLAEMIGDLHYESLVDFFNELSVKFHKDSIRDSIAGKFYLGQALLSISMSLDEVKNCANEAWQISKPFMNAVPEDKK